MNTFYLGSYPGNYSDILRIGWASGKEGKRPNEAQRDIFLRQLDKFGILYFDVGHSPTLIQALNSIPGWKLKLKNKLIYAQSAGISALTTMSYNMDVHCIIHGTGVLPIKSIVHFNHSRYHWNMLDFLAAQLPKDMPAIPFTDGNPVVFHMNDYGG